jgi:hypothetical protein
MRVLRNTNTIKHLNPKVKVPMPVVKVDFRTYNRPHSMRRLLYRSLLSDNLINDDEDDLTQRSHILQH